MRFAACASSGIGSRLPHRAYRIYDCIADAPENKEREGGPRVL
jgi:hypothetical protein